jgi:hypothetical protein
MKAVTEVLRPYLATRGGRIILFQPDNEMDLFSHWFEDACGLSGDQPGFFQQFLRQTYADVAGVNAAWGTSYESLDQAQPLAARLNQFAPGALTRHKDYWRFQHWAAAEGMRWHAETYRGLGVDLPMIANYYAGGDVQNWRELAKTVDCVGIDWYPRNEFGGDPGAHRRFLDTCRYQRVLSPLPCIVELECGVWHGYHEHVGTLTPNHYRLTAFSALLAGIQGFNWYMLVGRDNWYYSPVSERGELRPELAEVFFNIHRVVRECDPPTLRKLTDTCVLLEPLHIGTDNTIAANPVLDALYAADLDFEVYDPELGAIEKPVMFYAAADWLSRSSQDRLGQYMDAGGTLVFIQQIPQRDENFRPHNGLRIALPDRVLSPLGKKVELQLADQRPVVEGAVWSWDKPPGEPLVGLQVAGKQQAVENADKWMTGYLGKTWICGYREPRGRGSLVVIGLPASAALVRAIHRWLCVPLYAQAELPRIQTALFERDNAYYLFAANMNDAELQTRVGLDGVNLPTAVRVVDLWTGERRAASRDSLVIGLTRFNGGAWRIEPA